ncbi:Protein DETOXIFICATION 50 [Zea mays]|uniref:Protein DETOXIFICATION 50 n=1 Tax=Zea mays TaxID=4577 RepID=A0A1D6I946_MAIZE|nr:Protein DETOXIFICATION 50 [Zea mays]
MLWVAMNRVLVSAGQDPDIAATAYAYILCCLPDLVLQCFLHPIRIYLRAQSVTLPLTDGFDVVGIVDEDKTSHAEAAKAEVGNTLFIVADCVIASSGDGTRTRFMDDLHPRFIRYRFSFFFISFFSFL